MTHTMPSDTKPKLTPKLRYPEFRDGLGWDTARGNELFDQINNREAPAGLPILAITQEHGAIPRDDIDYHVAVTEKSVDTYKEVRPGDFIISLRSFQGGIEYSEHHGICSPAYVILRKRAELSDQFFKHLFKSHNFIQQLTKNLEGLRDGKMISYKQFSELLLPNPNPFEQQKIAECLSTLVDLIGMESQKLDALQTHKKGLMQQLFPREGKTLPRLRFPEFHGAPQWESVSLGNIAEIKLGKMLDSQKHTTGRLLPYLNNISVRWNEIDTSNLPEMYFDDVELERFALKAGDIVVCEGGEPGRAAVWDGRLPNLFYSTGIPVCILVLKKCKKPDDVLFINAAEHFQKGKRQNVLLDEHIDKIVETYKFRKEEERYSKRISMQQITEEGYNLNISRYISTATVEPEIDLAETHKKLVDVQKTISSATEKHNQFLKELGLPPLPGSDTRRD